MSGTVVAAVAAARNRARVAFGVLFLAALTQAASACVIIDSPEEFNNIRNNPANDYCVTANIDLSSLPGSGYLTIPTFSGILDGGGHSVAGLRHQLFGALTGTAIVRNIGLVNVVFNVGVGNEFIISDGIGILANQSSGAVRNVSLSGTINAGAHNTIGGLIGYNQQGLVFQSQVAVTIRAGLDTVAGGLVGYNYLGKVQQSSAIGSIKVGDNSRAGGLVGYNTNEISFSAASVTVVGSNNVSAGGLVGHNFISAIRSSSASGIVSIGKNGRAGGLVGRNEDQLTRVHSSATVVGGVGSYIGGLVGSNEDGKILQCYETGPVQAPAGALGVGGLVGYNEGNGINSISQCYALGIIRSQSPTVTGGLVGRKVGSGTVTSSYWNPATSGVTTSQGGTPITTAALQGALPAGFPAAVWKITPNVSTPYFAPAGVEFSSALATTIKANRVFVFSPVNQLARVNYISAPAHAANASLAASYTALARAIGASKNLPALRNVLIDQYFWNDGTQQATFTGPVTAHATLGPLTSIAAATPLSNSNVLAPLRADKLVLLFGTYKSGAVIKGHSMLATSFIVTNGVVTHVVADDPWTGRQVQIAVGTKAVTKPAPFPLLNFKVTAYRVVSLK